VEHIGGFDYSNNWYLLILAKLSLKIGKMYLTEVIFIYLTAYSIHSYMNNNNYYYFKSSVSNVPEGLECKECVEVA